MKSGSFAKYSGSLLSILQTSAVKQLLFLIGVAVSVASGIVLFMSIKEPIYQPLDYQVTSENMGAIVDSLEKAGIEYKINDKDGVVLVAAKDVQKAKVKLSSSGISKDENFSYAFLNEQNGFSNSQFVDSMRYLHALESDLAKTINGIEGISGTKVHIAIPKNNVYADEHSKVTASVMIRTFAGFASNHEKIRSIMQIVADSVPGLDPKEVAISDQYGHFLSESLSSDSIYNAAQLNYQNSIQSYYEKRIEGVITPILGENKITVRVNANIDYTQQEDAQEEYDPDKKTMRSEQTTSEKTESGGASGAPGSTSNSPPEDSDKHSSGGSSGHERSQSNKEYALTKLVTYKKSNSAKIKSLSAAIAVDNIQVLDPKTKEYVSKPLDKDMINKITDLVKATIGYDESRGDKVTVVNSVYSPIKEEAAPIAAKIWEQPWFWETMKRIIGILLGFIFLFVVYRKLSKVGFGLGQSSSNNSDSGDIGSSIARSQEIQKDGLERLKLLASSEPTKVALIIKNWVGKQ
jgi:flagellar M-ring protein FliF